MSVLNPFRPLGRDDDDGSAPLTASDLRELAERHTKHRAAIAAFNAAYSNRNQETIMKDFNDKAALTKFQNEAVKALEALAKEHGVTVRSAGGTIKSTIVADLKFQFTIDDAETKDAVQKSEFEGYCDLYGLLPSDYRAKFTANGKTYTLIGFNPSRPKYCIRVLDETGKEVFFDERAVPIIVRQRAA
jgi:hypothetical protein